MNFLICSFKGFVTNLSKSQKSKERFVAELFLLAASDRCSCYKKGSYSNGISTLDIRAIS